MKTGDITGTQANAYLALVPFELGTADIWSLDPSSTSGPDYGANVMCLTCHRAHASAFQDSCRWDYGTTFIADSHPSLVTGELQEMMGGTAITVGIWFPNSDYTKNSFAINAIYWTNFDPSTVFVFSAWRKTCELCRTPLRQ